MNSKGYTLCFGAIPLGICLLLGILLLSTGYVIFEEKSESLVPSTCNNTEHNVVPTQCSYSCNCITHCRTSSSGSTSCTTICQTCYYTCYDGFVKVAIGLYPLEGKSETDVGIDDRKVVNRDTTFAVLDYLEALYPLNTQYNCYLNPCATYDSFTRKGDDKEFKCNSIQRGSTLAHFRIPNSQGFLISGLFFIFLSVVLFIVLIGYYYSDTISNTFSSSSSSRNNNNPPRNDLELSESLTHQKHNEQIYEPNFAQSSQQQQQPPPPYPSYPTNQYPNPSPYPPNVSPYPYPPNASPPYPSNETPYPPNASPYPYPPS